jgi:hypothetical protein
MTKVMNKTTNKKVATKQPIATTKNPATKQNQIINLLQRQKGATIAELTKLSGWQEHSMRGFMSGTLKKRMGLNIVSEKSTKGTRRYRISGSKVKASATASRLSNSKGQA